MESNLNVLDDLDTTYGVTVFVDDKECELWEFNYEEGMESEEVAVSFYSIGGIEQKDLYCNLEEVLAATYVLDGDDYIFTINESETGIHTIRFETT